MSETVAVIVAIPPVGERVHKVSSEKVPHLTLLYLGDADLSAEAVLYVQHACAELSPFGLSVDHRGTLGDDEADVLFFEDTAWHLKRVKEFRHYLLLNDEIKRAYDAAEQFPEWTPHLTLGYPEAPAKDDDEDDYYRLRYIEFDRIAVWSGDFEGPEFRLKYEDHAADVGGVAMSDITPIERGEQAVEEMFHYGVKGMKWGVRSVDKDSQPTLIREKQSRRDSKDVTVTQRKAGKYVKTKGGERQKATDDAVRAAAARQKAKKSTTDALTNAELKAAVDRMQLEQQYSKLNSKTKRRGSGFVSRLFKSPEGRKISADLAKQVAKKNK